VQSDQRIVVTELSLAQQNAQQMITQLPIIPLEGEARLRQVLGRMATLFTIESQLGVDAVERVAAGARCVVQLVRAEPGLIMSFLNPGLLGTPRPLMHALPSPSSTSAAPKPTRYCAH